MSARRPTTPTRIRILLTFCAILCAGGFALSVVHLSHADDVVEEKYNTLEELAKKKENYQKILDLTTKKQTVLTTQVESLAKEVDSTAAQIARYTDRISFLSEQKTALTVSIKEKQSILDVQRALLADLLRAYYEKTQVEKTAATLIGAGGAFSLAADDYVSQMGGRVHDMVTAATALKNELEAEHTRLITQEEELRNLSYQLEERSTYLESTRTYKETLLASARADAKKYAEKIRSIEEEERDIQREIDELENSKTGEVNLKDLPSRSKANFGNPVDSPIVITQSYGKTSFSSNYASGRHNGTDFGYKGKDAIRAVADGRVLDAGEMKKGSRWYGYGRWIVIDHGNGLATLYGHLKKIEVDRGDRVKKGDRIGTMGNTGFSTGTHLHFTVFARSTFDIVESTKVSGVEIPTGATVNPANYLPND